MRAFRVLLVVWVMLVAACGRAKPDRLTLQSGKVERVEGCHIRVNHTVIRGDDRFAALNYACGVPESALHEEKWWGDQPEPLGFSIDVGDCLSLDPIFYCVEEIEPDNVSIRATYKWANRHHHLLERIR